MLLPSRPLARGQRKVASGGALCVEAGFFVVTFPAARETSSAAHLACTAGAALVTYLQPLHLPSPSEKAARSLLSWSTFRHPNAHRALVRVLVSPVGVSLYSSSIFVMSAQTGSFLGGIAVCLQG
jgi:hypothetical protein